MICLHCKKWWEPSLLKQWQDNVAFWFQEHTKLNPNLYCPTCVPIPKKERCIHCALHWPEGLVWRRCCPPCKKRIRKKSYPTMTEQRFSKLYRET